MSKFLSIILFSITFISIGDALNAQELTIYNPQTLYDEPGGMFDTGILRTMFIDFEDADYHNTLVDAFFENPALRIPAIVSMDDITVDSVAVRYKGNSTFCLPNDNGSPKLPYNLDFNFWSEESELMGYHKIKLANAWLDPTFAKEYMAALIYRRYLPTPEVNLLALNTQGDYTGIYVNTESINKQFLKKHFSEQDGALFKCDPSGVFCIENGEEYNPPTMHWMGLDSTDYYDSYVLKSEYGWAELIELTNTVNNDPENISEILNVDRVLWALAVNQVVSNLDTYNGYYVHNYYLYLTENGLWQMIPWDLDNSFIGAILGWDYYSPESLYEYDIYDGAAADEGKPLTHLLLNDPLYRKQYEAHIRTIIQESLDPTAIAAEVYAMQSLAYDAVSADNNNLFTMNQFTQNVEEAIWYGWGFGGILSTVEARREYLLSHYSIDQTSPEISSVDILGDFADATGYYHQITTQVMGATDVTLMATTSPHNSHFTPYPMTDDGTGIYSANLPFTPAEAVEWKFYIRAETENTLSLSPARAEYEFYHYTTLVDGVDENLADLTTIKLLPNPTSSQFVVRGIADIKSIEVYDYSGRHIYTENSNTPISVENWTPGVYLVEINTNNGHRVSERIVVCD